MLGKGFFLLDKVYVKYYVDILFRYTDTVVNYTFPTLPDVRAWINSYYDCVKYWKVLV